MMVDVNGLETSPRLMWREYQMNCKRIGNEKTTKAQQIAEKAKANAIKYADNNGYYTINGTNKEYQTWDNIVDAKRHMEWNARMANEIGYNEAQIVGNNHELVSLREKGWFLSENGSIVKTYMNQATVMDLRNNAIGRNLTLNSELKNASYDKMFNYALEKNVLITDANNAFSYFGINDCADQLNRILVDWDVENDRLYVYTPDGKYKYWIDLGK